MGDPEVPENISGSQRRYLRRFWHIFERDPLPWMSDRYERLQLVCRQLTFSGLCPADAGLNEPLAAGPGPA